MHRVILYPRLQRRRAPLRTGAFDWSVLNPFTWDRFIPGTAAYGSDDKESDYIARRDAARSQLVILCDPNLDSYDGDKCDTAQSIAEADYDLALGLAVPRARQQTREQIYDEVSTAIDAKSCGWNAFCTFGLQAADGSWLPLGAWPTPLKIAAGVAAGVVALSALNLIRGVTGIFSSSR